MWNDPAFDEHERVVMVHDRASGLNAIIAIHSTHRGPAAGGTRFWHYADPQAALTDALRLSQGMSFKNAMAGLPVGGGKAVILAGGSRAKTPDMLAAFGDAIEAQGGAYVTAEDVGMSEADMVAIAERTAHVTGLPASGAGRAGGDPGPYTSRGVYLGIRAAVKHRLGSTSLSGVRIAMQGTGSVGSGLARLLARDGADITLADIDAEKAKALASELGAMAVPAEAIMAVECEVFSPNALGGILDGDGISHLNCAIVAGGANNQLATVKQGRALAARDILYAPDYVINAGGIIAVTVEYLARIHGTSDELAEVDRRIDEIPGRLQAIWHESAANGVPPGDVADAMARVAIGRG